MSASTPKRLCPLHQLPLLRSEKQGIEIDYCPQCKGAWFERGELDKVIELYADLRSEAQAEYVADRRDRGRYLDQLTRSRRSRKLEDLLEDLFDFD